MPPLKISLPDRFNFQTRLNVRITDINYGQHLGNDALLSLLHEARLHFLKNFGFSEIDAGGSALMMTNISVQFKSQARYGDSLLFEITACNPTRTTFDMVYRITREKDQQLIALAQSGMIFFDYTRQKVTRMPEEFRVVFDA